jgi:hypothetical protein
MALIRMPKSSTIKPAAGHFSLLNSGLYCGNYTTKEIRQGINNKDVTKFTVAEFIQGNFLYDFVSGFV